MKRLSLGVVLLALASAVLLLSDTSGRRRQERQVKRLAIVQHASQPIIDEGVRGMMEALAAAGYVDGQTLSVRRYNAEGDMPTANTIAAEVVGGDFDLILTATTPSLQTVANANRDGRKLHVFGLVTDPLISGVGITGRAPDQHPPWMVGYGTMQPVRETFALARQLLPNLERVGEVWNSAEVNSEAQTTLAREVCREMGIELLEANAESSAAVQEAAGSLVARGVQAIWVPGDVTVLSAIDSVVGAARRAGIPVFSSIPGNADRGVLLEVGANYHEVGRIAGELAVRVLRGTAPSEIGVVNVMPERIVVNRAALAGLHEPWRIPEEVAARAGVILDAAGAVEKGAEAPASTPATGGAPLARLWNLDLLEYVSLFDVDDAERGIRASAQTEPRPKGALRRGEVPRGGPRGGRFAPGSDCAPGTAWAFPRRQSRERSERYAAARCHGVAPEAVAALPAPTARWARGGRSHADRAANEVSAELSIRATRPQRIAPSARGDSVERR